MEAMFGLPNEEKIVRASKVREPLREPLDEEKIVRASHGAVGVGAL